MVTLVYFPSHYKEVLPCLNVQALSTTLLRKPISCCIDLLMMFGIIFSLCVLTYIVRIELFCRYNLISTKISKIGQFNMLSLYNWATLVREMALLSKRRETRALNNSNDVSGRLQEGRFAVWSNRTPLCSSGRSSPLFNLAFTWLSLS